MSREEFVSPRSRLHGWMKPEPGTGLWTSTYDERFGSDWVQWCLSEEFEISRSNPTVHLWTLDPLPEARVFRIHTYADLDELATRYADSGLPGPIKGLDWESIAQDFDAVHLTAAGQFTTRFSVPWNLYGWDCESTVWLNWAFGKVADLGAVRCEGRDPWWEDDDEEVVA